MTRADELRSAITVQKTELLNGQWKALNLDELLYYRERDYHEADDDDNDYEWMECEDIRKKLAAVNAANAQLVEQIGVLETKLSDLNKA